MSDSDNLKNILTLLIKKQMLLVGKSIALDKVKNIDGLKVAADGTVTATSPNLNYTLEKVLEAFTTFPSRIAANEIIEAKSEQAKQVREQIASGWLQMEYEKAHLDAAIDSIPFGLITTNEDLTTQTQNKTVESLLGPGPNGVWTINDLQGKIGEGYFLPLECKKSIDSLQTLPPAEVNIGGKPFRLYISPIRSLQKIQEVAGVSIIIQPLAPSTPAA